jgi:hypothetical protein
MKKKARLLAHDLVAGFPALEIDCWKARAEKVA